ncbi:hypothetical protein [Mycobacterium triplex]|uniref:hypothetical protein n=1 Tax=Mycobacterium triplex TaxID=47839 RepID=UPI0012EBC397|nr:hypothetical protein [Mycobacterium triplex]
MSDVVVLHREDTPLVRYALEVVTATIVERQAGSQHERRHRARHEHLVGLRDSHDSRCDVHRDAMHIAVLDLDLPRRPGTRG